MVAGGRFDTLGYENKGLISSGDRILEVAACLTKVKNVPLAE